MNEKRLEALLQQATVDCYGEEEEFTSPFLPRSGSRLRFRVRE